MFQTIDTAEPNFPVNLFTPEEDAAETGESDLFAIHCCSYQYYYITIDSIGETEVDV